jgi:mannose-1-phosphate guanylyltransferase
MPKREEIKVLSFLSGIGSSDTCGESKSVQAVAGEGGTLNQINNKNNPWSIVLAGGDGERLRPLTERWLGRHKPKQYCTFVGTRSMFQHTQDRADQISPSGCKLTVIGRSHKDEAHSQLATEKAGSVISQPRNCDTGVGIFLALTHIRAHDQDATVIIFPSDHFVYPEDKFIGFAKTVAQAAQRTAHWLFLLAASPDRPEPDYGWIEPGRHLACINEQRVRAAKGFMEKPGPERCRQAMTRGALWNTLIMAARLETLWKMGWICFPEVMRLFEAYGEVIGTSEELNVLGSIYEVMPSRNFSTHLLERVPSQVAILEMKGVLWCDWGRPNRILETLAQVGKRPVFSMQHAAG